MIKEYKEYLKNNPEGYWFRAKWYGWGWTPVKWQGWVTIFVYIILVLLFGLTLDENSTDREAVFTFVLPVALLTITLIRICYAKGERPHWNWGNPDKK